MSDEVQLVFVQEKSSSNPIKMGQKMKEVTTLLLPGACQPGLVCALTPQNQPPHSREEVAPPNKAPHIPDVPTVHSSVEAEAVLNVRLSLHSFTTSTRNHVHPHQTSAA